jgi:putative amino-acid transport system permease protein
MGEAQLSAAVSYKTFETYIIAAAFYWILALILGKIQRIVERKIGVAYQK